MFGIILTDRWKVMTVWITGKKKKRKKKKGGNTEFTIVISTHICENQNISGIWSYSVWVAGCGVGHGGRQSVLKDATCWCLSGRGVCHQCLSQCFDLNSGRAASCINWGNQQWKLCKSRCSARRLSAEDTSCAGLWQSNDWKTMNTAAGQQRQGTTKMWSLVTSDWCVPIEKATNEIGISYRFFQIIVEDDLSVRHVCTKCTLSHFDCTALVFGEEPNSNNIPATVLSRFRSMQLQAFQRR
jgi:hypothetical protein